jgi:hypothetical protein
MVQAYSLSTQKTIKESLADLSIDTLISPAVIDPHPGNQDLLTSLQKDHKGIRRWVHSKEHK